MTTAPTRSVRFLFLVTTLAVGALALAAGPKRKVIIDQDAFGPGGPNLQPILMVLQAPDVEVLGITIESGDGWQKENTAHTLRMLELIGRTDVPVVAGATNPLINSQEETKRWEKLYGNLPYKGAWTEVWPDSNTISRTRYHAADVVPPLAEGEPTTKPLAETAAAFLVRQVRAFPGEVTILALGPFTNVALATQLDPTFAAQAKGLVFMGGSFNPAAGQVDVAQAAYARVQERARDATDARERRRARRLLEENRDAVTDARDAHEDAARELARVRLLLLDQARPLLAAEHGRVLDEIAVLLAKVEAAGERLNAVEALAADFTVSIGNYVSRTALCGELAERLLHGVRHFAECCRRLKGSAAA